MKGVESEKKKNVCWTRYGSLRSRALHQSLTLEGRGYQFPLLSEIFWVRLGIPSPKSSRTLPLPYLLSSLHASLSERYEGLPSPRCNPIKKSRNWFLILVRCCISPHLWEHTASIISHLITPRKNGYRAAVVSDARGQTCKLKSNLSVYLMYLLKIWK